MAAIVGARASRSLDPGGKLIGAHGASDEMLERATPNDEKEIVELGRAVRPARRLDEPVRALLRRRGAAPAAHARRAHRPRARPRAAVRARARGAAGARARRRAQVELHRARGARAAHAGHEHQRRHRDAPRPRSPARRGAARAAAADAPRAGPPARRARRAAARPLAPRRGGDLDPSRARLGPRARRGARPLHRRRAGGRRAHRGARGSRGVRRPVGLRPDPLQPRRERAPLRRAARDRPRRAAATATSGSPSRTAGPAFRPSSCPTCSSASRAARSRESAGSAPASGLAIARSYANAHRGDLVYEPASPTGARFELVLPNGNGDVDDVRAHRLRSYRR